MYHTTGNGRLLVLVNSSARPCDRFLLDETIFGALTHMGLPFATLDMATQALTPEEACGSAALVLAQENITASLDESSCNAIAQAVSEGVGLINFDYALRNACPPMRSFLKLEPEHYPVYSDLLVRTETTHMITARQEPGGPVQAKRCLPVQVLKETGSAWQVLWHAVLGKDQLIYTRHLIPGLSLEPSHVPALAVNDSGRGRVVQFLTTPRLWMNDFIGHAAGLDDVFYRALVWAARKPFVAKPIPPFVTARIDDCSGAHDFQYVDILSKYGYIPSIACFWDRLSQRGLKILRKKHDQGLARFQTHAFSYYDLMYFDFGKGEYPEEKLRKQFEREDEVMSRHGLTLPTTAHAHWNAMGTNVLPCLKERGRTSIENPCRLGEMKCERTAIQVHPYHSPAMGYDFLEEDPEFFRFFCQFRAQGTGTVDFLEGNVLTWLGQSPSNNVDQAIANGISQVSQGLDGLFFGQIVSHEQKLSVMTLAEIEKMIKGIDDGLRGRERLFRSLDDIAAYLREHRRSRIASASVTDGKLEYALAGPGEVRQVVRRYEGDDEGTPETV